MTDLWAMAVNDILEDLRAHVAEPGGTLLERPGVMGLLDSPIPFPCYVHTVDADLPGILPLLEACRPVPRLHVVDGHPALGLLADRVWPLEQRVRQMVLQTGDHLPDDECPADVVLGAAPIPQGIPAFHAAMAAGFGDDLEDAERELPAEVITSQGICLFVARDQGGRIIGTAGARRRGRGANLFAISVVPEHRGRGIGGALTVRASRAMFEAGAQSVQLHATEAGHRVYERAGFEVAGRWSCYRPPVTGPAPAQVDG